nr:acetyl-/propionyl-coenzyme A carboxylase subunit alpha [Mycolicibacterium malmesburyense]
MITRVLVANRGEIARRVFATCRRLGIGTVAVYTDPDEHSPHVGEADARVRLQGRNGYLDGEQLIGAARAAGADAIHPGYGFLSENAEFAGAVVDAGLTWIGPPVAAVAAMGSKIEANKIMAAAGVPVLDELDPDTVTADQLPVLIKALAGGGGRGMRVVTDLAQLPAQVEAARREAASAFGDPTVFCEHYLATGHHVEVQVLADEHGTVWSVGERECSIQRRHQEIIEEAPSPLVERTPGMRAKLFDAARLAAAAIGYTGAGTVEFMADENGDFFFFEMNTRLQVEHPVTEETTGLDLVAATVRRPRRQARPRTATVAWLVDRGPTLRRGPRQGMAAAGGRRVPVRGSAERARRHRRGQRFDGVDLLRPDDRQGHRDRTDAASGRGRARRRVGPHPHSRRAHQPRPAGQRAAPSGVPRRRHRHRVLRHPRPGRVGRAAGRRPRGSVVRDRRRAGRRRPNRDTATGFAAAPSGWRNLVSIYPTKRYTDHTGGEHEVCYRFTRSGVELPGYADVALVSATAERVVLRVGGVERPFDVARYGPDLRAVFVDSPLGPVQLTALPASPIPTRPSRRARCWHRCPVRCCASALRPATP